MENLLKNYLLCLDCRSEDLVWGDNFEECGKCRKKVKIENGILRCGDGAYHSNFGLQWNKFSTVLLDSVNGSVESEKRLL